MKATVLLCAASAGSNKDNRQRRQYPRPRRTRRGHYKVGDTWFLGFGDLCRSEPTDKVKSRAGAASEGTARVAKAVTTHGFTVTKRESCLVANTADVSIAGELSEVETMDFVKLSICRVYCVAVSYFFYPLSSIYSPT